ncbi:hypothetical protein CBS101457_006249 [Exobasidium rhododendri]|nr:hypothetical protein CBS101457_006249 [Exobasidium rhododendri]
MAHRRFGAFYARSFERRPWVTLAVANGTLGAIADTLAQTLERYQRPSTATKIITEHLDSAKTALTGTESSPSSVPWDVARTGRFFAFGVMMAPLLAQWNNFIEFRFPLRGSVGSGVGSVAKVSMTALAKRVSVDQLGFAPFGLACFVGAMGFMEGRDMEGIQSKFKEMFIPALLANWKVWPAVQTINFRYMPLRYRVPFTGAVGIAWQVFLSILNAAKKDTKSESLVVS